jgi:hypothetical protein
MGNQTGPNLQQVESYLNQASLVRIKRLLMRILIASSVAAAAFYVEGSIMQYGDTLHAQGYHADTGESLLFGIAFGIPAIIGAFAFIITIINLVDLLRGRPRASKSPEDSIRKFYNGALTETGFVARIFGNASVSPDCLFYLTPGAVEAIGGWPGFLSHWRQVNDDVRKDALKAAVYPFSRTAFKYISAAPISQQQYGAKLTMTGFVTAENQEKAVYTKSYDQLIDAVQLDGRWSLEPGSWR